MLVTHSLCVCFVAGGVDGHASPPIGILSGNNNGMPSGAGEDEAACEEGGREGRERVTHGEDSAPELESALSSSAEYSPDGE